MCEEKSGNPGFPPIFQPLLRSREVIDFLAENSTFLVDRFDKFYRMAVDAEGPLKEAALNLLVSKSAIFDSQKRKISGLIEMFIIGLLVRYFSHLNIRIKFAALKARRYVYFTL
jgi:hypothetical protein